MSLIVCECPGGETFEARAWCPEAQPPYTWLQVQVPGQNPVNAYGSNPSQIDEKSKVARYVGPMPTQPFTVGTWGYDAQAPDPDCSGPAVVVDPATIQPCPTQIGGFCK